MSLIYDKNVAYKPGNVSKMFLDNAGYKQQQDNINNHENAQKLDVSALSAQEEINGTECVGLLLEHWKDVAGAGDNFRDFGTGVVAPTLYKEQMSVNKIDEENAKSIATDINNSKNNAKASWATDLLGVVLGPIPGNIYTLTEAAQTINQAITYGAKDFLGVDLNKVFHKIGSGLALTPPSVEDMFGNGMGVADPFDDYGLYGGDQGGIDQSINFFWTGWIIGENDDIYDFVRSHKGYENYSDKAVHDLLSELEGGGCTYVAMANAIFWQYRDQGDLFEKKLGFPIIGEDGDLNFKKLIIDLFLNTKNKIYLDDPNGQEHFAAYYKTHIDEFRKTFNQYYNIDKTGHYIPKYGYSEEQWINQAYENLKQKGVSELTTDDDFTCYDATFNRLAHYSKEKNLDIVVKDGGEELDKQKIKEALDNGYNIVVSLDKFKLQFEEGTHFMFGIPYSNHAVTITGIAPDGRYIVSSWGQKLYLDPKEAEVERILHIKREPQTNPGISDRQPQMNLLNPIQGKMALNINVADQENADSGAYYISKEQTPGTGGFRKNMGVDIPLPLDT